MESAWGLMRNESYLPEGLALLAERTLSPQARAVRRRDEQQGRRRRHEGAVGRAARRARVSRSLWSRSRSLLCRGESCAGKSLRLRLQEKGRKHTRQGVIIYGTTVENNQVWRVI